MLYISTKSQIWTLDFIIAIIIFTFGLILFYIYSINLTNIGKSDIDILSSNAKVVSGYLVSKGYPEDWDINNVTLIGLTDGDNKLNLAKVQNFNQLATSNYTYSKRLLSTRYDYYVFFEDKNNTRVEINGIEWIGKNYEEDNPKNIIKVYRFVVYKSTILRLGLYVW